MPPPSRQTHAFSPQGSHPRLTRGTLAVPSQFVSGRGVRGADHEMRPADHPSLHREVLRAYTATRTRAGAALQLQNQAYPTTKGVYLGG
jgi:hypothetical protein